MCVYVERETERLADWLIDFKELAHMNIEAWRVQNLLGKAGAGSGNSYSFCPNVSNGTISSCLEVGLSFIETFNWLGEAHPHCGG